MMMERYVPAEVLTINSGLRPVVSRRFYPAGHHPEGSPIRKDMGVVQLVTDTGDSRWYGCENAVIDSYLRMRVYGLNPRDEVLRGWEVPPETL